MSEFEKEVVLITDVKKAITDAIDATIKTMKQGDLKSADINFKYMGMEVKITISDNLI